MSEIVDNHVHINRIIYEKMVSRLSTLEAENAKLRADKECPKCRCESLSAYADKYGIIKEDWTQEQCLEAMKSIQYWMMDYAKLREENTELNKSVDAYKGERKMKFRKKPVVIEAVQWFPGVEVEGVKIMRDEHWDQEGAHICTLEGPLHVSPGDWIITGVKGERYPCKPDIFEATYESFDD